MLTHTIRVRGLVAAALLILVAVAATTVKADSISDYIETRVDIEIPSNGARFQAGNPVGFRIRVYWNDTGRGTAALTYFVANQLTLKLDYGDDLTTKTVRSFLPFERVAQGRKSGYIVTDRELNRVSDAGIVFPGIEEIARSGIDPGSRFWSSAFFSYGSSHGAIWTPDPRTMSAGEYQASITVGVLDAGGTNFSEISSQARMTFSVGSPPPAQSTPTPTPAPAPAPPTPSPVPSTPAPTRTWSAEAQDALARLNYYRQSAGAAPLALNPHLTTAAEHHANYYLANRDYTGLDETSGNPVFTGANTSERVSAAGYPTPPDRSRVCAWGAVTRQIHSASAVIDRFVNAVSSRTSLLSPLWVDVGFGMTEFGASLVLGSPTCRLADADQLVLSPGPGQTNVPAVFYPRDKLLVQLPGLEPNWVEWGDYRREIALGSPISVGRGVG